MKQNRLPSNKLDIITPVLSYELHLSRYAETYPELVEIGKNKPGETHLYPITKRTPLLARKATEIIGYYFRREFGYDFPPYNAHEDGDVRDRVFLLTQEEDWETEYAVGAIVFRWRKYTNASEQLVLSWVWIHPFLRRQGILTAYLGTFRKHYGDFQVDSPHSKAMKAFLEKMRTLPTDPDVGVDQVTARVVPDSQ